MVQFYALSVVINVLCGLLLTLEENEKRTGVMSRLRKALDDRGVKFALGIGALVVGVFKILTPIAGDVPVIGDLLPALAGVAVGGVFLTEFYRRSSDVSTETVQKLDSTLLVNKRYIGILAVGSGILHFLMPGVLIV